MEIIRTLAALFAGSTLWACTPGPTGTAKVETPENCPIELVVLGVGQDAGAPQIGNPDDPAWKDPSQKLYATSLGLLDHDNGKRYLFEATPDIREQMQIMDMLLPYDGEGPYIDGIFLTHAHIGHYGGLMFLGRESMGAKGVPVYAMPRMKEYLETNGPWSQLVELGNIELIDQSEPDGFFLDIMTNVGGFETDMEVAGILVPHRDEFSETVGYMVINKETQNGAIFLPDIDQWEDNIEPKVLINETNIKYAFFDATFYNDNELPGRDMSKIPHPRVTESMDLIEATGDDSLKDKVRFIHINHTNPLRDKSSPQYKEMIDRGFKLAYRGERFCL